MHLLGPTGLLEPLLFSSQNIVRWTYPAVLLTEYSQKETEDEEERKARTTRSVYADQLIEVFVTCANPEEDWSILERKEKGELVHGSKCYQREP